MTSESPQDRWDQVERLFTRACDLPQDEREAFLTRECGDDARLLTEVQRLLATRPPSDFMRQAPRPKAEQEFGAGMAGSRLGAYVLHREIGRGGMGVIYLASTDARAEQVALKLLPPAHSIGEARTRFEREINAASSLDHPSIVPIYDFGETEGVSWYAMEYVAGHDWSTELQRQRALHSGTPQGATLLPSFSSAMYLPTIADRLASLADALQAAHDAGVVHRDVKPQNVLLDDRGAGYLTDFGLAKDKRFGTITATDAIQGTPFYMSPEQARAVKCKVDHRTDIYSLGVVLYESLTLCKPFDGKTPHEVITQIGRGTTVGVRSHNPRVPRDLELICRKSMRREPADRYQAAGDMAEDLRRFLRHEAVSAKPLPLRARIRRWAREHRVALLSAAVGLVAIVGMWKLADHMQRSRQAEDLADRVQRTLDDPDWLPRIPELAALRASLDDAERAGLTDFGRLGRQVTAFEQRLTEFKVTGRRQADEWIERGLGRAADGDAPLVIEPYLSPARPTTYRKGIALIQRLGILFPDDAELARIGSIASTYVELNVDAVLVEADGRVIEPSAEQVTVQMARLDPLTDRIGPAENLESTPVRGIAIPAGRYRIRVDAGSFGHADLVRVVAVGARPLMLRARIHRREIVTADMVQIGGGRLAENVEAVVGCHLRRADVVVPPFHLDRAELSNREVERYLQESGAAPPFLWGELGYAGDWRSLPIDGMEEEWPDRPAAGLSVGEARACAEWYGKRLPLHVELEYALQGVEPNLLAKDESVRPRPGPQAVGFGSPVRVLEAFSFSAAYRHYLASTRPVRDEACLQRQGTFFHLIGNVFEITDSPLIERSGDRFEVEPSTVVVLGCDWAGASMGHGRRTHRGTGTRQNDVSFSRGVRLAY